MFKRLAVAIGALLGAATLLAGAPGTANADTDMKEPYTCGTGYFCVWETADGPGNIRYYTQGNGTWPSSHKQDDLYWRNAGTECNGCDHVRIWDSSGNRTLCVHRGHYGNGATNGDTVKAQQRGVSHSWGGECGSNEPQL